MDIKINSSRFYCHIALRHSLRHVFPSPPSVSLWATDAIPDDEPATIATSIRITKTLARHGFESLIILQSLYTSPSQTLDPRILLTVVAFSSRDACSTSE